MKGRTARYPTVLFVAGFLLAGVLHVLDRLLIRSLLPEAAASLSAARAFGSTALFVLNLAIYIALLAWWLVSVWQRLLPSRGRSYLLLSALFMLFFLMERAVKYRLTDHAAILEHVCWYAYYIPLCMIPALFLLTCLSLPPEPRHSGPLRRAVWGLALALSLGVATNDLHYWMFRPLEAGDWSKCESGPLWYAVYGFVILCVLLGLALLAKADRRRNSGRRALRGALLLLLTLGMMYLGDTSLAWFHVPAPYFFPETFIFGMLGIFESCIRSRLIPCNENYAGFFSGLRLAAEITDPALRPVYRTAQPVAADPEQRRAALMNPTPLDEDRRLYGKALAAGYAFWTVDERTLRLLNEELADAAEVLETENDLLRHENEQKEQRARIDARNQVYAKAAGEVYGTLQKLSGLLEGLDADAPDYGKRMARVLVLFAYVKRKMNFVLMAAERETVSARELALALEESVRFLALCGLEASVERKTDRAFSHREAVALYDSFQLLAECLLDRSPAILVSLAGDALRILAECAPTEPLPEAPAAVEAEYEGGQLYLALTARTEADDERAP